MEKTPSINATFMTRNEGYPATGYSWYVAAVLFVVYTLAFVDRSIIGYLVDPIRADFGINDMQFALLQNLSFSFFYSIMSLPLGRLADSRSRHVQLTAGVLLWTLMTILAGKANSVWVLAVTLMGIGLGEACLVPCAYSMISDYFAPEKRTLPLNIFSSGIMFGTLAANVLGGLVSQYAFDIGPTTIPVLGHVKPWQYSFILVGLPGIPILVALLTVKEPSRKGQFGQPSMKATFRYILAHWKTYTSVIGGTTFGAMTNGAILGWLVPWFSRRYGWSNVKIGSYLGTFSFVFGSVGVLFAGILANRLMSKGKKAVTIKLMIAAEALVLIPIALAHAVDNPYWVLWCVGGIIFFGGFSSSLGPATLQNITPNEMRGQITAICFLVLSLIAMNTGMPMVGLLTSYVFHDDLMVRSSAVIVGLFASICGVLVLIFGLRSYEKTEEMILSKQQNAK